MNYQSILNGLKNKKYKPIYFLYGNEPYFIDIIADYIEDAILSEGEKSFNLSVFYGLDSDPAAVIGAAKRYPVNADLQVVILKEAQGMRNIENLLSYIENPVESTIFVICYKKDKLDKRTVFAKTLINNAVVLESKKLYENKVPQWIEQYLNNKGYSIQPQATMVLTEYLGNNISNIVNELNKLMITQTEGKPITLTDIEKNIGISRDYNIFELQNALGSKDVLKANRIVNYFAAASKSNPFEKTIGGLNAFFSKVYMLHSVKNRSNLATVLGVDPYFVKDYQLANSNYNRKRTEEIITLLHEYDLRSKGVNNVNTDKGELLKEMVYKILH